MSLGQGLQVQDHASQRGARIARTTVTQRATTSGRDQGHPQLHRKSGESADPWFSGKHTGRVITETSTGLCVWSSENLATLLSHLKNKENPYCTGFKHDQAEANYGKWVTIILGRDVQQMKKA